jgi:hypothetical protein
MPKPPPTSPTTTRTLSTVRPGIASARLARTPVGIWLDRRTVSAPSSTQASTLRGSIGAGATRWFTRSSVTWCAAWQRPPRGRGVAVAHLGADVVGRAVPQHRRAGLQRAHRVDVDRQVLGLDEDGIGRGARGLARCRPRWPPPARRRSAPFVRQRALGRRGHRLAVGAHEGRRGGDGLDAGGHQVGAGVDRHHARRGARGVESMATMRPCATVLRTKARNSCPRVPRRRCSGPGPAPGRVLDAAHGLAAAEAHLPFQGAPEARRGPPEVPS